MVFIPAVLGSLLLKVTLTYNDLLFGPKLFRLDGAIPLNEEFWLVCLNKVRLPRLGVEDASVCGTWPLLPRWFVLRAVVAVFALACVPLLSSTQISRQIQSSTYIATVFGAAA